MAAALKYFHDGEKVSIDKQGVGTVISYMRDGIYDVLIDDADYRASIHEDRLTLVTATGVSSAVHSLNQDPNQTSALPHRSDEITDSEIEQLWESGQLGTSTPESMLNTLWFNNTVHFGFRGCDEHKQMKWGDVELHTDSDGLDFLEFTERITKTRTGLDNNSRKVAPKMWSTPLIPERCPVALYRRYASMRPTSFSDPGSPFYISTTTLKNPKPGQVWFKSQNLGIHKLETIMKRMASSAGLSKSKKLTNHSARKHLVQKLNDNNVPPSIIMQVSGHKNVQSINNYSRINSDQHRNISMILSNAKSTADSTISTRNIEEHTQNGAASGILSHVDRDSHTPSVPTHGVPFSMSSHNSRKDELQSVFSSSYVTGGTFNININNYYGDSRKRKRPVIDSDSD